MQNEKLTMSLCIVQKCHCGDDTRHTVKRALGPIYTML